MRVSFCLRWLLVIALLVLVGCDGKPANNLSAANVTPSAITNTHAASSGAGAAAVLKPDRSDLEQTTARESRAFLGAAEVGSTEDLDASSTYRVNNRLIVLYGDGLTLATVNATRAEIREKGMQRATIAGGLSVDVSAVDASTISQNLAAALPAPSSVQASPTMLSNRDYICFSRYLANKYGLTIAREVYYSKANWCVFNNPTGLDEGALAVQIQRENNDIIECVDPDYIGFPAGYEPRARDPKMDCFFPYGDRTLPAGNGPQYWNNNECYAYFQCNAHRMHPSGCNVSSVASRETAPGLGAAAFYADSGVVMTNPDLPVAPTPAVWPPAAICEPVDPQDNTNHLYWDTTDNPVLPFVDNLVTDPDYRAHGTKVAGVIGARHCPYNYQAGTIPDQRQGIIGMIPYGHVYPFKISQNGIPESSQSWMAEALVRAFAARESARAWTINMSYYMRTDNSTSPALLGRAIFYLFAQDPRFILVTCAGNENEPVMYYDENTQKYIGTFPAAFAQSTSQVISVMAVDHNDARSNWGDKQSNYEDPEYPGTVTISAPGGSSGFNSLSTSSYGSQYGYWEAFNGTSAASPYVCGMVAMLQWYGRDALSADIVKEHLVQTARTTTWGGGALNSDVKPILNCDSAIAWADVTLPVWKSGDPRVVISGPTRIEAHFKPATGLFMENPATATASIEIADSNTYETIGQRTGFGTFDFDPLWNAYRYSVILDPDDFPDVEGDASISVVLGVQGSYFGQAVWSMPLYVHVNQ
jgi:hypothetical protein